MREGTFRQKILLPNKLLKLFFVFTLVMVFAIVYLPALNIIFTTKPIFEWHIWVLIFSMSFLTSIFRLIVGSIWRKGYKNE